MDFVNDKIQTMDEGLENEFEKLYEDSFKQFQEGELVTGVIVKIAGDAVVVDIGYKSEGIIPTHEFYGPDGLPTVSVGEDVTVLLVKWEDDKGHVVLSKSKADQLKVWDDLIESCRDNSEMEGVIAKRVKGGYHVDINGVMAFLPNSQVDLKPIKDPDSLIGQTYGFRVIKYNRRKSNVIVSRRVMLEEQREKMREQTLSTIDEGSFVEGIVKNITDYGAFVDLGGLDGLVHLSDLSWGKVSHPSQILKIGDTIIVKVLKFDKDEQRISLGLKQTRPDPWLTAREKYPIDSKVPGKVVNIADYGAFVEIEQGLEGLVHISEMAWTKIRHPSQKLKVGDEVTVMVLDMDPESKRLSLGIKQVESNPWEDLAEKCPPGSKVKGVIKNITDFGVFVGIDQGIDGLVHVSDISWKKIKHPSEIFKRGQEVEAVVLNIDKAGHRFSLSTKLLEKNPWQDVGERYNPGMIVDGRVTSVADFGAFVQLEQGLEGLVHVSELNRGKQKGGGIRVNDAVEVEILNVNCEERKIGLSIRSVTKATETTEAAQEEGGGSEKPQEVEASEKASEVESSEKPQEVEASEKAPEGESSEKPQEVEASEKASEGEGESSEKTQETRASETNEALLGEGSEELETSSSTEVVEEVEESTAGEDDKEDEEKTAPEADTAAGVSDSDAGIEEPVKQAADTVEPESETDADANTEQSQDAVKQNSAETGIIDEQEQTAAVASEKV